MTNPTNPADGDVVKKNIRRPHDNWFYHCEAWGESDRPVVSIVQDIAGIRRFFIDQWFGEECPGLSEVMEEVSQHDFDDEEWRKKFEIGGICVRRVYWEQTGDQWWPIGEAPKDGRTLLLGYRNSHGNWRTLRGRWFSKETIESEWEYYEAEEGWYEESVECGDDLNCWFTNPTHFMPLPKPPHQQCQHPAE